MFSFRDLLPLLDMEDYSRTDIGAPVLFSGSPWRTGDQWGVSDRVGAEPFVRRLSGLAAAGGVWRDLRGRTAFPFLFAESRTRFGQSPGRKVSGDAESERTLSDGAAGERSVCYFYTGPFSWSGEAASGFATRYSLHGPKVPEVGARMDGRSQSGRILRDLCAERPSPRYTGILQGSVCFPAERIPSAEQAVRRSEGQDSHCRSLVLLLQGPGAALLRRSPPGVLQGFAQQFHVLESDCAE